VRVRRERALFQGRVTAVLLLGIAAAGLVASDHLPGRLDLTAEREFTLAPATTALLDKLEDRLQVKLYFNRDLEGAEAILPLRLVLVDLLEEMRARAHGRMVVETVDPTLDPAVQAEAERAGIAAVPLSGSDLEGVSVKNLYQGLTLRYQDREKTLPFLVPERFEYTFATALAGLEGAERPVVGFFSREPSLPPSPPGIELPVPAGRIFENLRQALGEREAVRDVGLDKPVPGDLKALFVARPADMTSEEVAHLDAYLAGGGRVCILADGEDYEPRTLERQPIHSGLDAWLGSFGIRVSNRLVFDEASQEIEVARRSVPVAGGETMTVPVRRAYGFWPLLQGAGLDRGHVITAGIAKMVLMWAHPLFWDGLRAGLEARELLRSSPRSWLLPPEVPVDRDPASLEKRHTEAMKSGPPRSFALAAVFRGDFSSAGKEKDPASDSADSDPPPGSGILVVVGDSHFLQNRLLAPGNRAFAQNLADWLVQDAGLIALRTRGARERKLRDFRRESLDAHEVDLSRLPPDERNQVEREARGHERALRRLVAWGNVLAPVLLVLAAGLAHGLFWRRRARRPYVPLEERG